jgi:acetyl esterase/lipase
VTARRLQNTVLVLSLLHTAVAFLGAQAQPGPGAAQPGEAVSVESNVQYGAPQGQKLFLDVYRPGGQSARARPAVVLIHGGGWTSLDKSTMRTMGDFLARRGFVAFSVDYRLFEGAESQWPAQLDDVQRSIRWVRANASKYGVDPDHVGAFGHSAGAQLAALLGMEDTRDNADPALAKYSSRVQAVVDVSGPANFTPNHDSDAEAFLTKLFGGDYSHRAEVWRGASPLLRVSKTSAPFLILHGTHDQEVPIAQSQSLFEALQRAGVPAKFVEVDDVHTFKTPEARRRLAFETLEFFQHYLVATP